LEIVGILSVQNEYDTFFKISVDVSAHFPKMRIRFGGKAKQQAS
jgi:hypothetical protein